MKSLEMDLKLLRAEGIRGGKFGKKNASGQRAVNNG